MKCSIMQPSHLPWAGYFNLIKETDLFVFLDDAQFSKNSWHSRNKILINCKESWIGVPIKKKKLNTSLNETEIDNSKDWKNKHLKTLKQNYCKHPFKDEVIEIFEFIEKLDENNLATFNIKIIKFISKKMNFNTKFINSSKLDINKKRTAKIIEILNYFKVNEYLSPIGAKEYLIEDNFSKQTAVELIFQKFKPKNYTQFRCENFVSHLSIIDIVANIGWKQTMKYVS